MKDKEAFFFLNHFFSLKKNEDYMKENVKSTKEDNESLD